MRPARIAVVGAGWWASAAHLPSLTSYQGASVVAIVDPSAERRDEACARFGVARGVASIGDLGSDAEGVLIATPHPLHGPLALQALRAGLHVFVEKPMATSAADAWEMVRLASEGGLHLMVGYTTHFTETARRAREVVASGRLGRLVLVSAVYSSRVGDLYAGRVAGTGVVDPLQTTYSTEGGGQARTQITHAAGVIAWVTGLRVRDVRAHTASLGFGVDVVDAAAWRFDNGALGTIASTGLLTSWEPGVVEYRFWGTAGSMVLSAGRPLQVFGEGIAEESVTDSDGWPAAAPSRHFADLIAGRSDDNPASGEVGARAVELVEAIVSA